MVSHFFAVPEEISQLITGVDGATKRNAVPARDHLGRFSNGIQGTSAQMELYSHTTPAPYLLPDNACTLSSASWKYAHADRACALSVRCDWIKLAAFAAKT